MYLFFDTETTGIENLNFPRYDLRHWPRMVQIGWLLYDDSGKEILRDGHIVKPEGFTIPDSVVDIHGITTERAFEKGVPLEAALKAFSSTFDKTNVAIGHNVDFDLGVVDAEFRRKEIPHLLNGIPRFCTMKEPLVINHCKLKNPNFPDRYKWPKLPELYFKLFGKKIQEAHDALIDAEACADCFFQLKNIGVID